MKTKRIVAIFEPDVPCTNAQLNSGYHEQIDELIRDPSVRIIISENFLFGAKYLNAVGFRNCTVYHIGDEPKHSIGKFKNKGGFTSVIELVEALRQNSTEKIYFVNKN